MLGRSLPACSKCVVRFSGCPMKFVNFRFNDIAYYTESKHVVIHVEDEAVAKHVRKTCVYCLEFGSTIDGKGVSIFRELVETMKKENEEALKTLNRAVTSGGIRPFKV